MTINSKFLQHKRLWSAYTTLGGMDIQCFGDTELNARRALFTQIIISDHLLKHVDITHLL